MFNLLHEGAINLKDGQSIRDFLEALRNAAVEKVVPLLPAAKPGADGSLPYQHCFVVDATSESLVVVAERYGRDDHFRRHFQMEYTSADGVPSLGEPEEVMPATAYVPIGTAPLRVDEAVNAREFIEQGEAVAHPKAAERRNLPPEAFAAPFYEGEDGTYEEGGIFNRTKSQLPHHTAAVKKANDDATVDLPRLRNAMTKFQKAPWSSFGEAKGEVRAFARRHLTAHATRLLKGDRAGECVEEGIEDALLEMAEMEIREALRLIGDPTPQSRAHAADVFEQYSGTHHLAPKLGAALSEAASARN